MFCYSLNLVSELESCIGYQFRNSAAGLDIQCTVYNVQCTVYKVHTTYTVKITV